MWNIVNASADRNALRRVSNSVKTAIIVYGIIRNTAET